MKARVYVKEREPIFLPLHYTYTNKQKFNIIVTPCNISTLSIIYPMCNGICKYNILIGGGWLTGARVLRISKGLSITALSHEIRANPSILSMMERRRLAPSRNVREALSLFFSVPENQLFDDDGLAI